MRLCFWFIALLSISTSSVFAQTSCMEFTTLDGVYGPSGPNGTPGWYDVFHTEGNINLSAQGFQDLNGSINGSALVAAGINQFSGAFYMSNGVFLKTAPTSAMIYEFPVSDTVTFNYYDNGTAINLGVNNEQVMVEADFIDLPTAIAPGVTMIITPTGNQGIITLIGYISKVIVGGSNLGIDNFCQYSDTTQTCLISEVSVSPQTCNNGTFMTDIDLIYSDTGSLGFTVSVNGTSLGTYSYSQLPITVGPLAGDGTTEWIFTVADVENTYCTNNENIGVVTCTVCAIENVYAEADQCTSSANYSAYLEFTYSNNVSTMFDVYADGALVGSFLYSSIPVFPDMPSSSNSTQLMTICDGGSSCCVDYSIVPLNCTPNACSLSGFYSTPTCGTDGTFDVELGFSYANEGTNFNVSGNGTNYGDFAYADLPITINGLAGDNTTNYVFNITDDTDQACTGTINLGTVNCSLPCDLSNMTISSIACDSDSTNTFVLDFDFTGDPSNLFRLTVGGTFIGLYNYSSLPATISNIPGDGQSISVSACDDSEPSCCTAGTYISLDCAPAVCDISNFTALPQPCNGGLFDVEINFTPINQVSTTFNLTGNGTTYGTYTYASLPVTVSLLPGDNVTNYEFFATDSSDPSCSAGINIGTVLCEIPCDFSNLSVDSLLCESDSTYSMALNLAQSGTTGSSFNLNMNGAFYGNFAYADLPVHLVGLPANGATVSLQACDEAHPNCCTDLTYTAVDCAPAPVCEIGNLDIEVLPCDAFGEYNAVLDFDHSNTSGSFIVRANLISYGTFNYADLPVTIGSFIGNGTDYTIEVEDNGPVAGCMSSFVMTGVDCPIACDITAVETEALECTSDSTYSVFLDFNYSGSVSTQFKVNASNGQLVGTYAYSQLPVTINNFPAYGATLETMTIFDAENPDCIATKSFDALSCQTVLPCEISGITATASDCDSANMFTVTIDLTYANVGATFNLTGNNGANYGTYSYTQLPITVGPLIGNGTIEYEFFAADVDNPNCVNETTVGIIDCTPPAPCELTNLTTVVQDCDLSTGLFMIELDMTPVNGGTNFIVTVNGGGNDSFTYTELPVMVGPFFGDGVTNWNITVVDADSPNCIATAQVDPVTCTTQPCELSNLIADPIECTSDSTYSLELQFNYENVSANGFEVFAQGMLIGTYSYADLPLEISDFPIFTTNEILLNVCDTDNPNCCTSVTYVSLDCEGGCNIFEVITTPFGCDQGEYTIELDLDYENVGSLGFQVFGNGENYGNFNYNDLPINFGSFSGDGQATYEFIVIDLVNTTCFNFSVSEPFDCTVDCEMSDIHAEAICGDSTFMIELGFDHNNTSADGFMLNGNGVTYGAYSYDSLPVSVGPFEHGDLTDFEFVVTDMINDNCSNFMTLGQVGCSVSSTENLLAINTNIRYDFNGEEVLINLEEALGTDASIEIYNAAGMKVLATELSAGHMEQRISMAEFASGWYMVRMSSEDGQIVLPFVKAR
jgi:hypothetical protein